MSRPTWARTNGRRLRSRGRSYPRLGWWVAMAVCVPLLCPAIAQAHGAGRVHRHRPAAHASKSKIRSRHSAHRRSAAIAPVTIPALRHSEKRDADLLSYGAGYASPHGSSAVRAVQRRLSGLGYRLGRIDGRFGPRTARAVMRFQAANGLGVDGIVGPATVAALASPAPLLRSGTGEHQRGGSPLVREVQRWLSRLGAGPGPIDGRYGPLTTRAVRRFQRDHGLSVDGIVGAHTWHTLLASIRGHRGLARRHVSVRHRGHGRKPGAQHKTAPGGARIPAPSSRRRAVPTTHGQFPVAILVLVTALLVIAVALSSYLWTRRRARHARLPVMPEPPRVRRDPRPAPTIEKVIPRSKTTTAKDAPRPRPTIDTVIPRSRPNAGPDPSPSGPVTPWTAPRPGHTSPKRDARSQERSDQPVPDRGRRR